MTTRSNIFRRRYGLQRLEQRELLTAVPFGAGSQDTAEFLLGDVSVNVVFLESNGAIDEDTEQWTPELAEGVKANIEAGLDWWSDTLDQFSDVHELNFHVDYTFADEPVEISYEPISRGSQDFVLWIEEFFRAVDVAPSPGFTREIRTFNHQQRLQHDTNWSFTIFVVNAENDPNDRFGDANANGTVFSRAFAYPGGQFIVMPHTRPGGTVAHEVGHMFWAFDEYSGSDSYNARRGYYRTQNTNAFDNNPDISTREPSIMASTGAPWSNNQISQSARETIGWKDSDNDGIFDVLDVEHTLNGTIDQDHSTGSISFVGHSHVNTLPNLNTSGTGNAMTINRITGLQYRVDLGSWIELEPFDGYEVSIDSTLNSLPQGTELIEFRTIDHRTGVVSNVVASSVSDPDPEPVTPSLQNALNPLDVNGDEAVSAVDVLHIIIALNEGFDRVDGPPFLDVSGDSVVSARDALLVINHINERARARSNGNAATVAASEPSATAAVWAAMSSDHDDDSVDEFWNES